MSRTILANQTATVDLSSTGFKPIPGMARYICAPGPVLAHIRTDVVIRNTAGAAAIASVAIRIDSVEIITARRANTIPATGRLNCSTAHLAALAAGVHYIEAGVLGAGLATLTADLNTGSNIINIEYQHQPGPLHLSNETLVI